MLIDALGGKNNIYKLPSYIDFIHCKDMEYPVMIGIDKFNRSFVTMRYNVYNNELKFLGTKVESFFQRYTNNKYCWTSGETGGFVYASICQSRLNTERSEMIKTLLSNKKVKIPSYNASYYIELMNK
jgi:hypothetical protein